MNDFDIGPAPGQITDQSRPIHPSGTRFWDWREIRGYGYEWASVQHYNPNLGGLVADVDLSWARGAGFESVGVWFASYDQSLFYRDGMNAAVSAIELGADHLIADVEMCAKYTRPGGMKPLIDGIRAGGWDGPVHLSTLGAPVNAIPHGGNDFGIDAESFLETGGSVQPQAYYQAYEEYRPDLCCDYWEACGVPRDRLNVTIDLLAETGSAKYPTDYTGAEWADLLRAAGVGRNFSVYMTQFGYEADYEALKPLTEPEPEPEPPTPGGTVPPLPTDVDCKDTVRFAAQTWESGQDGYKPRARLVIARRVCDPANVDEVWTKPISAEIAKGTAARDAVKAILDDIGLPL